MRRIILNRSAVCAVLVLIVGCSSGTGGGTGGGAPNTHLGTISVVQYCKTVTSVETCTSVVSAEFASVAPPASSCTTSMVAGCEVVECPLPFNVSTASQESAGTITVSGTFAGSAPTLVFADAGYESALYSARILDGGELLAFTATGATVPAFTGRHLTAPNPVRLTTPPCNSVGCINIRRSTDLNITWTGGASAEVNARLSSRGGNKSITVTCRLVSSPGIVPSAAMGKLGKTDAGYENTLNLLPSTRTSFVTGAYDVTLSATVGEFDHPYNTLD